MEHRDSGIAARQALLVSITRVTHLLGAANSSRPIPFSKETPRLRRFNLALLPHIDLTITVPAAASNSSQHTEQENADEPHTNARSFGIPTNDGDK